MPFPHISSGRRARAYAAGASAVSAGLLLVGSAAGAFAAGAASPRDGSIAAQANLQTALTVAKTSYTENNQTFDGFTPATFHQYDTGLSAVDGRTASSGPSVISLHVAGPEGQAVILAASAGAGEACWGIVEITTSRELDGFTGAGTLYVELPKPAGCTAIEFNRIQKVPGSFTSTTGWSGLPS